jgi:hypothetical protein
MLPDVFHTFTCSRNKAKVGSDRSIRGLTPSKGGSDRSIRSLTPPKGGCDRSIRSLTLPKVGSDRSIWCLTPPKGGSDRSLNLVYPGVRVCLFLSLVFPTGVVRLITRNYLLSQFYHSCYFSTKKRRYS